MRIVIDGRMLGWTGIGRYTHRLLKYIEVLDTKNQYIVVMSERDKIIWSPKTSNFEVVLTSIQPYSLGEQTQLPRLLNSLKPDLVHFPHFTVPILFNGPFIVTIQDLTLVDYKNIRGHGIAYLIYELKYLASRLVLSHAIRRSKLIITSTNFVKNQLVERFRVPLERITVANLGTDFLSKTYPKKDNVQPPYLFYLGNSYPYKNLNFMIKEFAASEFRKSGGKLFIAGPQDYFRDQVVDYSVNLQLGDSVRFFGRVSDEELSQLYTSASAFIFPSLSEGFGLGGLEAMMYGIPLLASSSTCLPEVYGEAADYFEPSTSGSLTAAIDKLVLDTSRQKELIRLGSLKVKHYSWKAMTEKVLAAYRVVTR